MYKCNTVVDSSTAVNTRAAGDEALKYTTGVMIARVLARGDFDHTTCSFFLLQTIRFESNHQTTTVSYEYKRVERTQICPWNALLLDRNQSQRLPVLPKTRNVISYADGSTVKYVSVGKRSDWMRCSM